MNIVDVKERNLKRESGGQEGACESRYLLKDGLFLTHAIYPEKNGCNTRIGRYVFSTNQSCFSFNFSLLRPPKMNLRARGLSSNLLSMSTQEASNFGPPTPKWKSNREMCSVHEIFSIVPSRSSRRSISFGTSMST